MEIVKEKLKALCKDLFDADIEPDLSRTDEQFGDYATNIALQLAGKLNKNPREIAETLTEKLRLQLSETVSEVTIAGPGFINLRLRDGVLWSSALAPAGSQTYANKTIVIETNNPNPFKDMHIGHAYNSIVADTIANLLQAGGGNVHRVSYHGDVGLHVGKTMWAVLEQVSNDPSGLANIDESDRPQFLSKAYAAGNAAYEKDDKAKQEIEAYAKESFSLNDPAFKEIYETCKAWSFTYFDSVFKLIGSSPIKRRFLEREADEAGRRAVEGNIGSVFEKSDGAVIFPGEKYGLHTRVFISSRGNTLYEARDLGLIQLKAAEYNPDASYIVTAVEQKEYFKVVFKAAELALPDLAGVTHNIPTGTVKLTSGKMSSRKGNFINIGWLIDEIAKALVDRGGEESVTDDAIIGALRYTMLKVRIGGDVVYDPAESVSLEGNSGPYLQYAHARARSILAKSETEIREQEAGSIELESGERSLVRKIGEYAEVVDKAVAELMPHHVCTYLYELAQVFNSFYEHNRVIGDPRQDLRLQLVNTYADTLKKGLVLLNISAPERM
jgi:arginyl-tRNA synthetase